jgi:hypothetical protein
LQQLHVFEIDQVNLLDAEAANLAALHPARAARHRSIVLLKTKIAIFVI